MHALKPKFILLITFSFLVLSLLSVFELPSLSTAQTNSDSVDELIKKGNFLSEQGQYEEAITYYDRALESDPINVGALTMKGEESNQIRKYYRSYRIL